MHIALRPLAEQLATDPSAVLLALDFDGTLSPIVDDPERARAAPTAIEALVDLADRGARIAIVTGRDAATVVELGGLERIPGVLVSGLHGAETWHEGQLLTRDEPAGISALRAVLPPLLDRVDPGVWLEDKRLSLVVHTRRAADPEHSLQILTQPVTALAAEHDLDVVGGKFVLEIRIPALSKADAVSSLLNEHTRAAMFCGDDLGDLPAFEAIRSWAADSGHTGVTIAVGEVPQVRMAADLQLDSPEELAELLSDLADQAGRRDPPLGRPQINPQTPP
ncbi:MAG: trehalose 6-phosphate phosphatase [Pseudonocardiales bacterium]|nr:trehalose 6-phosphate phosphatase [Pseudonocardiales bacterium]